MVIGLITINGKQILEVDSPPGDGAGTAAPIGSIATYDNGSVGTLYFKKGAADTAWDTVDLTEGNDWSLIGNALTGGSATTPNEFFGSTNNYDVAFRRNNTELMRIAADGLLVGLNASLGGRLQVAGAALGADNIKEVGPNGGSGSQVINVSRLYKAQTTDATLTTLHDILTPNDSVVHIESKIVARQHGGAAGAVGDGAAYTREIHAKNIAGVVTIQRNQTALTSEDVNAFNVVISASGANVRAQVLGAVNRSIAWFSKVEMLIAVN